MIERRWRASDCSARTAVAAALVWGAAGTAALADPPGPAHWLYDRAATTPLVRGQLYAGFTLNALVQQLPLFNGTQSFHDVGAPGNPSLGAPPAFSPDVVGVQPGGEIGYVFRDGTFPAWMGSRVRAALFGSYAHARTTDSQSTDLPPGGLPGVTYYGVDGSPLANLPLPSRGSIRESLAVERDGFQIGLKLEADIALAPGLSVTPAVAIFGGRIHANYAHTSFVPGPGVDGFPTRLDERLRTREIGGHLGARLTWQFAPGWALHAGGSAGPVWSRSRMNASDCLNAGIVTPGTPCGPSNGAFFTTSAADSRSAVGFRGTAALGLAVDARIAVISLGGFMRYDSRIPGIENPRETGNLTAAALAPARIRFDDGFAYGGFLAVRVAIP